MAPVGKCLYLRYLDSCLCFCLITQSKSFSVNFETQKYFIYLFYINSCHSMSCSLVSSLFWFLNHDMLSTHNIFSPVKCMSCCLHVLSFLLSKLCLHVISFRLSDLAPCFWYSLSGRYMQSPGRSVYVQFHPLLKRHCFSLQKHCIKT